MIVVPFIVFKNALSTCQYFTIYVLTCTVTWRFFASGTSVAMISIAAKPPRHAVLINA
jgi:ABC-type polysaccharide/polyol phosphate export permease